MGVKKTKIIKFRFHRQNIVKKYWGNIINSILKFMNNEKMRNLGMVELGKEKFYDRK